MFLILGVGIANPVEHSPHDSLVNVHIINFVYVNLLDSPNFYRIDSIIIPVSHIKKLSRLEELRGFVKVKQLAIVKKKAQE